MGWGRATAPIFSMPEMLGGINVYVTAWGAFELPVGLETRTKWRYFESEFLQGKQIVKEPEPISDNHEFFSWLHQQELAAGKPKG